MPVSINPAEVVAAYATTLYRVFDGAVGFAMRIDQHSRELGGASGDGLQTV